jgi:hypothetical protein
MPCERDRRHRGDTEQVGDGVGRTLRRVRAQDIADRVTARAAPTAAECTVGPVLARVFVVAVSLAAIAALAPRLADQRACQGSLDAIARLGFRGQEPAGGLAAQVATVRGRCRDTAQLAAASGALAGARRTGPATLLAREATRREPASFNAWVALDQALAAGGDRRGAAAAARRAKALNPRWQAPGPAPPAGPSGAVKPAAAGVHGP